MAKAIFRDYCIGCSNYTPLQRFVTGCYYCRSCLSQIKQALRKASVNWQASNPDKETIGHIANQVVEAIQFEEDDKRKKTQQEFSLKQKRWRVK